MNAHQNSFYVADGTLHPATPSYVERQADQDLYHALLRAEFCHVLTSPQVGKSSLMARTANRLRKRGIHVIALDLTALGIHVTSEQWFDGLVTQMGRQLRLEEELEKFWLNHVRIGPAQRFVAAIREFILPRRTGPLVVFIDEVDVVRSLPFSSDEFFSALRECYARRGEDREFGRVSFCLLGIATPSKLARDLQATVFHLGQQIELNDFRPEEAVPLAERLWVGGAGDLTFGRQQAQALLSRILYWTNGHPYLTQRLCRVVSEINQKRAGAGRAVDTAEEVDRVCSDLFLSHSGRELDDNLVYVRKRMLRSGGDLRKLLALYARIYKYQSVRDDASNPLIDHLRMAGISRSVNGILQVRNRVYYHVFDLAWIDQSLARLCPAENRPVSAMTRIHMNAHENSQFLVNGVIACPAMA